MRAAFRDSEFQLKFVLSLAGSHMKHYYCIYCSHPSHRLCFLLPSVYMKSSKYTEKKLLQFSNFPEKIDASAA